MKQYQHKIG